MQVSFPNLNMFFELDNVAFNIFGIPIYWYGVLFATAYLLSLVFIKKNDGLYNIKAEDVILTSTIAILFGIVGARIYYVLFNLDYYLSNTSAIFDIRNGGLGIYGGLLFGFCAIYIMSKILKFNLLDMLDYIVPYIAISQCIGRIGNFINVEAYGYQTDVFWKMRIFTVDGFYDVHPTFIYEMLITLVIFILLCIIGNKRKFKGEILLIYLSIYSIGRFIVEGFRADSLMLSTFKVSQVLSLVIFTICIFAWIYIWVIRRKKML